MLCYVKNYEIYENFQTKINNLHSFHDKKCFHLLTSLLNKSLQYSNNSLIILKRPLSYFYKVVEYTLTGNMYCPWKDKRHSCLLYMASWHGFSLTNNWRSFIFAPPPEDISFISLFPELLSKIRNLNCFLCETAFKSFILLDFDFLSYFWLLCFLIWWWSSSIEISGWIYIYEKNEWPNCTSAVAGLGEDVNDDSFKRVLTTLQMKRVF